jgi:integrase
MTRRPPPKPATPRGIEPTLFRDDRGDGWVWRYSTRYRDPVTGTRKRSDYYDTIGECEDFRAYLRLLKRSGTLAELDRGREILHDFLPRWITDWAAGHLDHRTLVRYGANYDNHLARRIGHLQLRHITPAVIDELVSDLKRDGVGDPTILVSLALLSGVFKRAVIWGEIPFNPVREVDKPKAKRKKVIVPLTVLQIELMLAWMETHARPVDRMLVELLAYTGPRPQDALGLPVDAIGATRIIYAFKNVDGEIRDGAKTGEEKSRDVEMLAVVRRDILIYRAGQAGSGLVRTLITRDDGEPWREHDYKNWTARRPRGKPRSDGARTGSAGPFHRATEFAGVPDVTPNWLRHTYVTLRLAEQRQSLKEIADSVGHDVDVLAKTYAHQISEYRGRGPIDIDKLIARERIRAKRAVVTGKRPRNAPDREAL